MTAAASSARARAGIRARFAEILFALVLQALILFLGAGRLWWAWAWLYLGICVVGLAINAATLWRHSPDLIAERGRIGAMRPWDRWITVAWSVAAYLALPLAAALEERLGWGGLAAGWQVAGAVGVAAALGFAGWSMRQNAFFSTTVRIQTERGHTVCRSGPYRLVRHPGYLAFIAQGFATALLLGSPWALVPAALAAALMVARTVLEDRTLRAELTGYADYATAVRWRLLPGVW